jgi:hypothetical protein
MKGRRGFTLLVVLWIIVSLSILAASIGARARHASAVTQGAHDRIVGRWLAEGCVARWQSVADAVLRVRPEGASAAWSRLDEILRDSTATLDGCELTMRVDGRPVLGRATAAQLASLPGITPEVTARLDEARLRGAPIVDLLVLESALSPPAKAELDAHYAELTRAIATEPDAWIVRAQSHVGTPPTPLNIEIRFVRGGTRAAIVRWVEW